MAFNGPIQFWSLPIGFPGDGSWVDGWYNADVGRIAYPDGEVLAVLPNGTYSKSPPNTGGPYETNRPAQNLNAVIYTPQGISYAVMIRGK
jgi:hypothetical protein